jgi:anti-sigma regulatory factor (Ser/Thr protein kinase)
MTEVPMTRPCGPPDPRFQPVTALRLLPWQGPEGHPASLNGNGGFLSRRADAIEVMQLDSARTVFDLSSIVLSNTNATTREVRFAAQRLRECLGDVLKVAENQRTQCALLARRATSPHVKRWTYDARCVGEARHELHRVLNVWGLDDDLADRAELVLSELLTNALRHTVPPPDCEIETRYELLPGGVRIEVHDADETRPMAQNPSADEETGRGLALVDALTGARWGVSDRTGVGKLMWAVLEREVAHAARTGGAVT